MRKPRGRKVKNKHNKKHYSSKKLTEPGSSGAMGYQRWFSYTLHSTAFTFDRNSIWTRKRERRKRRLEWVRWSKVGMETREGMRNTYHGKWVGLDQLAASDQKKRRKWRHCSGFWLGNCVESGLFYSNRECKRGSRWKEQ